MFFWCVRVRVCVCVCLFVCVRVCLCGKLRLLLPSGVIVLLGVLAQARVPVLVHSTW